MAAGHGALGCPRRGIWIPCRGRVCLRVRLQRILYSGGPAPSGLATYDQDVQRLVTEGIANRTVAIPDSAKLLGLGWRAEATYFVGSEGSPYLVVYIHPGT